MKALVAASQCPHCGHLLDLRDSFGELLPLTHCPTCSCDYLTRDGHCKWCGTTPRQRRVEAGTMWKAAGVIAFVGMAAGVWATREGTADLAEAPNDTALLVNAPVVASPRADTPLVAARPLGPYGPAAPGNDTPAVIATPVVMESAYAVAPVDSVVPEPAPPVIARRQEEAPARTAPAPNASLTLTPEPANAGPGAAGEPAASTVARSSAPVRRVGSRPARWRSVVARNWVTVRAAPRHGSRLLGSLGPDTRLQLGESRDGWVRVRLRGLSGWVHEARLSTRASRELARR